MTQKELEMPFYKLKPSMKVCVRWHDEHSQTTLGKNTKRWHAITEERQLAENTMAMISIDIRNEKRQLAKQLDENVKE